MTRRIVSVVGGVAVAVAGIGVGTALANHTFPDVATTSAFHTEVANVVGAGIATGFPDGTYRPTDPVNRQQMAAFLNRGSHRATRAGSTSSASITSAAGFITVPFTTLTMRPGAVGDTRRGFVMITASGSIETNLSTTIEVRVRHVETGTVSRDPAVSVTATELSPFFFTFVVSVPGASSPTDADNFVLEIKSLQNVNYTIHSSQTALYVPFSGAGSDEL